MRKTYLDGLRGWAAFIVLIGHLGPVFLLVNYKIPVLPFFMDGQLAVYVFFVLSGFVLSVGFFECGNPQILKALLIRRYPRLAIPVVFSCCLASILFLLGLMHNIEAGKLAQSPWLESFYSFNATLVGAVKFGAVQVFIDPAAPSYNAVLWTMIYELWGSVLLLSFFHLIRNKFAIAIGYALLSAVAIYFESPLIAFLYGAVLANIYSFSRGITSPKKGSIELVAISSFFAALLVSMLRTRFSYSPAFLSCMAFLLVGGVLFNSSLQKFLSNSVSNFLGHISFPLYLVHLLVICSWSSWLYIKLRTFGFTELGVAACVVSSTISISVFMAVCFSPVEQWAIRFSRSISNYVLRS
jgi:peptidoglycan/LPS O-acetylase OafA/YrhL